MRLDLLGKTHFFMNPVESGFINIGLSYFSIRVVQVIPDKEQVLVFDIEVGGACLSEAMGGEPILASSLGEKPHYKVVHIVFVETFLPCLLAKTKSDSNSL